ncbi:hypothetical protein CEE37_06825 [candidate division LCP-89 bacterium B3_LCP]|uniref:Uncharacterized protein n=1 Tax=candidate division LCP-89 bacterium B3_LCP TaxID=2012998 RepID=A0A532V0F3_UNCL8|nr:MAG: hypothetical protein CEE37_06825 [candidate division LCP-89 bacterium B3_LCP]
MQYFCNTFKKTKSEIVGNLAAKRRLAAVFGQAASEGFEVFEGGGRGIKRVNNIRARGKLDHNN